jgi:hypothetical protein|tara:strand:+ start:273 stop:434 length:162 start_codon:yes stop_codon:yes gene_type:complete
MRNNKTTQSDIVLDWIDQKDFKNKDDLLTACLERFGKYIVAEHWDLIVEKFDK